MTPESVPRASAPTLEQLDLDTDDRWYQVACAAVEMRKRGQTILTGIFLDVCAQGDQLRYPPSPMTEAEIADLRDAIRMNREAERECRKVLAQVERLIETAVRNVRVRGSA